MVVDAYHQITPEFLNTLTTLGLPSHNIKLKIGALIMLLRNLDQARGLCNVSRLVVSRLGNHVFGAKITIGTRKGREVYIHSSNLYVTVTDIMAFHAY